MTITISRKGFSPVSSCFCRAFGKCAGTITVPFVGNPDRTRQSAIKLLSAYKGEGWHLKGDYQVATSRDWFGLSGKVVVTYRLKDYGHVEDHIIDALKKTFGDNVDAHVTLRPVMTANECDQMHVTIVPR